MEYAFWAVAIVVFIVAEALSPCLVSIWFVLGSLGGLVTKLCGGPFWLQCVIFAAVSALTLILLRPVFKKYVKDPKLKTNVDGKIGKQALVTEQIDNLRETGAIKLDGLIWTARSDTGDPIPPETVVTVVRIEGVKAFVTPAQTN